MAISKVLAASLLASAAAHGSTWAAYYYGDGERMWGQCTEWNENLGGCDMDAADSCSDHENAGPSDATWEIHLSELPKSTPENPVHLQFWSGRAHDNFDLVTNPTSAVVNECPCSTYPAHADSDWNGGNVLVSEEGKAVLRVMAPSTYRYSCPQLAMYARDPHLHFRFCGGSRTMYKGGKVGFSEYGVYVDTSGCSWGRVPGENHSYYKVDYVRDLTNSNWRAPTTYNSKYNLYMDFTDVDSPLTPAPTTTTEATTTEVTTTTTTSLVQKEAVITDFLKESPNLDALEFSPVYRCAEEDQLYSQTSNKCVDDCEEGQVEEKDQCVREAVVDDHIDFIGHWNLRLNCGEACWNEMANETLHSLRLALGDHFDVPFQEAKEVRLRFNGGRRMEDREANVAATLTVLVQSRRLTDTDGRALLNSFMTTVQDAQRLLQLGVHSVEAEHTGAEAEEVLNSPAQAGEGEDVYLEHYNLLKVSGASDIDEPSTEGLPLPLLVGVSVAALLLSGGVVAFVCHRRRIVHKELKVMGQEMAAAKKIGFEEPVVQGSTQAPEPQFSAVI